MTERVQRRMLAELQTENRILRQQVGNALAKLLAEIKSSNMPFKLLTLEKLLAENKALREMLAENKSLKMPMPAGRHRCPTCNNLCCNE